MNTGKNEMSENLQAIVIKEIKDHLQSNPSGITLDLKLVALGIDSLGAITILYNLEDKLGIEIPNEELESLTTVGDMLTKLQRVVEKK